MANLLISFGLTGVIHKIHFDDFHTERVHTPSLFSLFDDQTNDLIHRVLQDEPVIGATLAVGSPQYPMILICLKKQGGLLFASDINMPKEDRRILIRLIEVIASSSDATAPSSVRDKSAYERIQALNNDLINQKRETEKLNAQLTELTLRQRHLLRTDPLTQLVSRYALIEQIEECIVGHPDKKSVFCFIDIDQFKSINDTFGHQTGDLYLIEFARRLRQLPLEDALRIRIAGDEFGVFLPNVEEAGPAFFDRIWKLLQTHLSKPVVVSSHTLPVSFSVGFAVYPDDAVDLSELFDKADKAMYKAKQSGHNGYAYHRVEDTPNPFLGPS